MARVERIREIVTGSVDLDYMKQKTEAGWKLVALEWRREIAGEPEQQSVIVEEIPYGLRVATDCSRLEEDPHEKAILVSMMELIVQDHSVSSVATLRIGSPALARSPGDTASASSTFAA